LAFARPSDQTVLDDVDDDAKGIPMPVPQLPQHDVAEARRAAHALAVAVEQLTGTHPDTLDLRRLAEDVNRVRADLDLIAGPETPGGSAAARDLGYDPREFVDGAYEGSSTPRSR
jgi:hypothetical protein